MSGGQDALCRADSRAEYVMRCESMVVIAQETEGARLAELMGWGRFPRIQGVERVSEDLAAISRGAILSRGLGRSYGDASLPPAGQGPVANTSLANRLLAFDGETGVLRVEAGFCLADLNRCFLPQGWASPVTPGTQYVTVGGMVAADVHGKNHHVAGCFGEHVRALRMRVADGRVLEVSDSQETELFRATLGGLGLTGHLLEVEFSLEKVPSAWVWTANQQVENFSELIAGLIEASATWPMTVAWVDSMSKGDALGRGILMKGRWAGSDEAPNHAPTGKRPFSIPFDFPEWVLNKNSIKLFNRAYFRRQGKSEQGRVVHPFDFFYPLDRLQHWNRIYGGQGFIQYQCVIPKGDAQGVGEQLLKALAASGEGSFLSVVKDCGREGKGMISFPMPGISLAFDVPMRGDATRTLVRKLNAIVLEAEGRIYLAKDALTTAETYRAMDPRLEAWNSVRRKWDPDGTLCSALAVRVLGG